MKTTGSDRTGKAVALTACAMMLALCAGPAPGLINPKFTPSDLVRSSSQVLLLSISAPKDNVVAAEVVEVLRGSAPAEKRMGLHVDPKGELPEGDVTAALNGGATAPAVLVLASAENLDPGKDPVGALQIGTQWFAVFKKDDRLVLDRDGREMGSVWAGSARMLAAATRYVEKDPTAAFPVKCDIGWGGDLNLGKLRGRANRCVAADLGKPFGPCVIVLSDGGDRVYQAAAKGGKPTDATEKLKLGTASKAAALGDFDGDGRLDLASWNGKTLTLASGAADGTFGAGRVIVASLTDCLSLDAIDTGAPSGTGLIVGTSREPLRVVPDGAGGFSSRPIVAGAAADLWKDVGTGGICVVADVDRDGRCDVIQVFSKGLITFTAEAPGRFKAPVKTALKLPEKPCAAVCGDFDTDGWLDIVVGGEGRIALLTRNSAHQWQDEMHISGELAYHGNANQPKVVGAALSDVNGDGRQGVALFYADRKPMAFFSRGFACFGFAWDLSGAGVAGPGAAADMGTPKPPLKGLQSLQEGQAAGAMLDLNGDGIVDMLAVDPNANEVWVLMGESPQSAPPQTLVACLAPKAAGPLVITVRNADRCLGMYVARPGAPAIVHRADPGPLTLEWLDAEGKPVQRKVVVRNIVGVTIP
jgi:hypothetical protein